MICYFKYSFISLFFSISFISNSYAQDFYKEYKSFLIESHKHIAPRQIVKIDSSIQRLHRLIMSYEKINHHSFFSRDTIYIVSLQGAETGFTSKFIWNSQAACYYHYAYEIKNGKIVNAKFDLNINALQIVNSFNKDFKRIVETVDTIQYHRYADEHKVFDGSWISPLMAIRRNGKWHFTAFEGNGSAIDF